MKSTKIYAICLKCIQHDPKINRITISYRTNQIDYNVFSKEIYFFVKSEYANPVIEFGLYNRSWLFETLHGFSLVDLENKTISIKNNIFIITCHGYKFEKMSKWILDRNEYKKEVLNNAFNTYSAFEKLTCWLTFKLWRPPNLYVIEKGSVTKEKVPLPISYFLKAGSNFPFLFYFRYHFKKMSIQSGLTFDKPESKCLINEFVKYYNINTSEIELELEEYKTLNEFFYRRLRVNARSAEDVTSLVSPADCRLIIYESVKMSQQLWIKGKEFSVFRLIGQPANVESILVCRLAPPDYHRFHSPVSGKIVFIKKIEGDYLSVHPFVVESTNVLTDNVRSIIKIETLQYGAVYVVAIGACMVGSVVITQKIGDMVNIMDELGYFKFGGSSIVVLIERKLHFLKSIEFNSILGIETLVKAGKALGYLNK
ncbi:Phosphatidylserine decarboxylase proenzyme 2 [Astathelohania contejeani]|uniref:Phosphatidylserine decarboxylase proenzyme 2 n=1 Tax=Astathelohania contejeani TaxID=164912 RepID=A0ABQ7HZ85_9MICR|nr:Phosphatidylserine decarboxylase proenzyme 2 [Thelohania contejeani]